MRTNKALEARMRAKNYFSIPEISERTGISRSTIYDAIRDGKLASIPVGKRHFVQLDEVFEFGGSGARIMWAQSKKVEEESR